MRDVHGDMATTETAEPAKTGKQGWFAVGGILFSALASACCIVPLGLVTLGISGAWIGTLTVFEPYKPWFAAVALMFIGLGFWHVYFKASSACTEDSYCARPQSLIITKSALWVATVLVLLAMTINWWAGFLY